jgi:DNA-binding transcriptional ArsR family regulator
MASRTATPLVHPAMEEVSFADVMEALKDPQRLGVIATLAHEPGLPCSAVFMSMSRPAASRHLKILRAAGLLFQWDDGTRRRNALRTDEFEARFPGLLDLAVAEGDRLREPAAREGQ